MQRQTNFFLKVIWLLLLMVLALPMRAQLRSNGPVPDDLKQGVQQLYDSYLQRAKDYTGERVRDRQLLMESSYYINKMLANGHIIYGDPLSQLVGRIADTLLKDHPELRSELRFYTVTSPDVNAFATPQGMVFINTGLMAQVENEAQLAFILSHEIVHYYRSHGLEELVGKDGKKRRSGDLDDEAEQVGTLLYRHSRSREMENEADSLGIALFYLQSPYAKDVSEGVFDVLQYGELPFDELPFDTNYFNTPYFKLTGCWLDSVADITSRDNYDDSRSTHPNILSRRQRTAATLDGYYGGENYVMTTKEEFEQIRHLARIECIRQDLLHGKYPRALYNSWVILNSMPEDPQIHRYIVQALYGSATFKNNSKQSDVVSDYKKIEGESQQVYYVLRHMSNTQATVVALHKAWEMHMKYPDEPAYDAICADLMDQLRTKLGLSSIDFLPEPPRGASDTLSVVAADEQNADGKPKSKYDRIKQKRQTQTERKPEAYALTDLMMADATLLPTLRNHLNGTANASDESQKAFDDTSAILIFNPCYWVVDYKKDDLQITQSTHKEESLNDRLSRIARQFDRRTVDFSDEGMHTMTEGEQYNDFLTVCEWMNEFWLTKGDFDLERTAQPAMDDLLYRYGARTLNMTAVLNTHGTSPEVSLGYIIILPFAPVIIPMAFTGIEQTAMVSMVIDARKGKVLARQKYNYDVADHNDMVDAMLYDTYVRALKDKGKEPVGCFGHRVAIAGGLNVGASGYQTFKQINKYLDYTPWVSVEVALKRSLSLAATVRYHHGYEGVTQSMTEWVETSYGYYTSRDVTFPSSRNMLIVGLELRDYKESDFAPLGYYIDYGAQWVHFTTLDGTPGTNGNNTFGLHIGIGRNYTFFQRLLLNWQVDYAYTYGLHKTVDFDFSGKYINYLHYADAIMSNIITIKAGIGFIPF